MKITSVKAIPASATNPGVRNYVFVKVETDEGITFAFGELTYFTSKDEPFYNIARKALSQDDYIPFYVEMANREGVGEEFRNNLLREVEKLEQRPNE